ncbi:hypothetical protein CRG98_030094 [Punica granatum]|uniref:Uncharacterized protein n=1 Tax=Punica granatum TaxID=22663 RepID=A0A2I0IZQ0_PUNGR|nr:hypothetical protein CRG98_030094 [Punica granatum]
MVDTRGLSNCCQILQDEAVPKPSPDPKKGAVSAPADVEQVESPGSSEALKEADLGEAETRVDD